MTKPAATIRITGRIARTTDKAVHFYQSQLLNAVWLARSQITIAETGERVNGHAVAEITLPLWLAKESKLYALPPAGDDLFAQQKPQYVGGALAREAALMCQEGALAVFFGVDAASVVAEFKRRCGIQSRAELDHKPHAAAAFKSLKADYQLWMHT